jgi:hypothetical protein
MVIGFPPLAVPPELFAAPLLVPPPFLPAPHAASVTAAMTATDRMRVRLLRDENAISSSPR